MSDETIVTETVNMNSLSGEAHAALWVALSLIPLNFGKNRETVRSAVPPEKSKGKPEEEIQQYIRHQVSLRLTALDKAGVDYAQAIRIGTKELLEKGLIEAQKDGHMDYVPYAVFLDKLEAGALVIGDWA